MRARIILHDLNEDDKSVLLYDAGFIERYITCAIETAFKLIGGRDTSDADVRIEVEPSYDDD